MQIHKCSTVSAHKVPLTMCVVRPLGGRQVIHRRDLQTADGRGGRLGDVKRALGSNHFLSTHCYCDGGGLRDAEESEPAS